MKNPVLLIPLQSNMKNVITQVILLFASVSFATDATEKWMPSVRKTKADWDHQPKKSFARGSDLCFIYKNHVVLAKQSPFVGYEVVIYDRDGRTKDQDCEPVSERIALRLPNPMGQFFQGLRPPYLFIDMGTGVLRKFLIYDLRKKKLIKTFTCHDSHFELEGSTLFDPGAHVPAGIPVDKDTKPCQLSVEQKAHAKTEEHGPGFYLVNVGKRVIDLEDPDLKERFENVRCAVAYDE